MRHAVSLLFITVCAMEIAGRSTAIAQPLHEATKPSAGAPAPADQRPLAKLIASIRANRSGYKPILPADLATHRAALDQSIRQLERSLTANGKNGSAWKTYLRWSEMLEQLALGEKADTDVLDEIAAGYKSGYPGFELPVFANVAKSLRIYTDRLANFNDAKAQDHFVSRLDALAAEIETLETTPEKGDATRVGLILGELSASGQSPQLVQLVRKQIQHPNLLLLANESIVSAGINDPINDVAPVRDVILGTRITGWARTVGTVRSDLNEARDYAAIDLNLFGTAYSNTVGRNGPAVVYASGVTQLNGFKRLMLDQYGFRSMPATSAASTHTTIRGVGVTTKHLSGLIQKIATKKVYQSKSQAERIASSRAQTRLNSRLDEQSVSFLAQANQGFLDKFRYPLIRFGAFPEDLRFSSTSNTLRISAVQADYSQIAAPTPAPTPVVPAEISLRVHESLINNMAATTLSGRKLTDDEMNRLMIDLTGKIPEELQKDADQEQDWSITFAYDKPIEAHFDNAGFTVTIRGEEYTAGERAYPAMNVTAKYKLEKGPIGIRAVRDGDLKIFPPDFEEGKDRLSAAQQSLRRILERRFGKIFKPELVSEGLELPGRWKKLGKLPLAELVSESGWMTLGWNQAQRVSVRPTVPAK